MFIENQSKYDFDETIEKLEILFKEGKWGVKANHNLKEMLSEKGFEVPETKVMEVCKPPFANRMLSKNDLRIYSNMMPCRLSVYKKDDGKTYVSRMNNEMFGQMIGGEVEEIIGDAFHEVEEIISGVSM